MCNFFNDRYTTCGHEKERRIDPCPTFNNAEQTKYCPNTWDNTKNTHIEDLCGACKILGPRSPLPVVPEYDYSKLKINRLHPTNMYAKPGEKLFPETKYELGQGHDRKLKAPKVLLGEEDKEPYTELSADWVKVDDGLEGEGVLVDLPVDPESKWQKIGWKPQR